MLWLLRRLEFAPLVRHRHGGPRRVQHGHGDVPGILGRGSQRQPAWSPDGSKIAFDNQEGDIFVLNLGDWISTTLSNHAAYDGAAAWSRDGAQIAFASDRDGRLSFT